MKELIYHKRKKKTGSILLPENWDEITSKQYLQLVQLFHANILDPDVAVDKALYILLNKNLFSYLILPLQVRQACYDHVLWVFEEKQITKQLLPKYKGLYGPESEFDDLTMVEFHHAEIEYAEAIKNNENSNEALNKLIAVLYRPMANGKRAPFTFELIEPSLKQIDRWPMNVKLAILIWYDGCRQLLRELYPLAFEGSSDSGDNYFSGLYLMMRSIAGNKYGTWKDVEQMSVHLAFMEIVASIEDEKRLEEQLKASKP